MTGVFKPRSEHGSGRARFAGWTTLKILLASALLLTVGCGGEAEDSDSPGGQGRPGAESSKESESKGNANRRGGSKGRAGMPRGATGDGSRGVPVEVATVGRQSISLFFETHGTLEAENEVDLVSRVAGPIVELSTEEGQRVKKGQLLARIDDRELVAQLDVARVRLEESKQSFERVKNLFEKELVARDAYDQSFAAFAAAKGDLERLQVQLQYTRITAPFSGLVIRRYVKFAEHVQGGAPLFRLSDFDPLLCPIQVPERELAQLKKGQRAELTVESFPGRRFQAKVLRLSPVVDAASGTVRVTLEVNSEGLLRPGMFAGVFLEMASRTDALVVPKAALALDSLGNTVFVVNGKTAERRDLELGFRNDELLEVLSGVNEGEELVVVGQDGLSNGTPIEILSRTGEPSPVVGGVGAGERPGRAGPGAADTGEGRRAEGRRGGFLRDMDWSDPDQLERLKSRMKERGLTDREIETRIQRMKERAGGGGQ